MLTPVGLTKTGHDEIKYIDYPPTVTVLTPGSEGQIYNGTIVIDWLATDIEEDDADLDISIEYSQNRGSNWNLIMSGVNNNYPPYSWSTVTSGVPDGVSYLFKVTAIDNKPLINHGLSHIFSIDNIPDDRWYLQIDSFNLGTHLDLDMKPSESESQAIDVFVPNSGVFPVQSFASEYVAPCTVELSGDWVFSIHAKVSSIEANGTLYANVFADDGVTPRLLFTTVYDDEGISSHLTFHEFYWVHSVPPNTMIYAGEHIVVEIMLQATAGSGPSIRYNYANADIPVNGTVYGDYNETRISDFKFERIEEIHRESGANATYVILDEDFSGGIPPQWTIIDGGDPAGSSWPTWTTENPSSYPAPPPTNDPPCAIVDAILNGFTVMNEELITPNMDLSHVLFVTLEFEQRFQVTGENYPHVPDRYGVTIGDVDVSSSLTGGIWNNVFRNRYNSTVDPVNVNITAQAAGAQDVQIRFHYYYYNNRTHVSNFWQVDNVRVQAYTTTTLLEHKWFINLPSDADPYEFSLEARRPDNPDGNNFVFAYSTDDVIYTDMVTVSNPIKTVQTFPLLPGLSGFVYIRVVDSDRTLGNIDLSRIEIDEMFITSYSAGANPVVHNIYPDADIPVVGNVTGNFTLTYASDNQYEIIDEIVGQESVEVTLIDEDFALGIPFSDGWDVVDGGPPGNPARTWNTHNYGGRTVIQGPYECDITEPFAIADAQEHGRNMDDQLITPVLDFTNATWVRLIFDDLFIGQAAPNDDRNFTVGKVQVRSSLTGGQWYTLVNHNQSMPYEKRWGMGITPWAAGAADVEVRFHYLTTVPEGWWMVDNVIIDGLIDYPISLLEHKWTIDVPGNEAPYIFSVEARRNQSFDHDNFIFSYSTDNINYKNMITAHLPDVVRVYTFSLPPGLSGTVYIRVIDDDRTLGNCAISRIEVDEMFISSVITAKLIMGLDHHSTPSYIEPALTLGPIAHFCIQEAPGGTGTNVTAHTMTTDDIFTVWAIGYDAEWNFISEIPSNWTNTLNTQTATSSTSFTFDPTAPGTGTITAEFNTTVNDSTGLITVTPGQLDHIVLMDSAGGAGNVIGAHSMTTDGTLTLWAAGYDADGNYLADVFCNWSTNGTLDPQYAIEAVSFTFDPSTSGTSGYILACNETLSDSAGLITVNLGALDHIIIRYSPGGAGSEVTDTLVVMGQTLTVFSAGYDAENNYIGDIPCNWTTTGTLNLTTATSSPSFAFKPAVSGENGTINATFNAAIFDESGIITVTEFSIDFIMIEDGLGNEVTTHNMTTDETFTVWAIGYNLSAGTIGPVNADWGTTGSLDLQTATTSQSFTFDPVHAPTNGTIETAYESLVDATESIVVSPGTLSNLCIMDAPSGLGQNLTTHTMTTDETLTLWSIGYDAEWNLIGQIDCSWTTTGTLDLQTAASVDTFTFDPTTTGLGIIEADDLSGHLDSTGLITVTSGSVAYIVIRDRAGGFGNAVGAYTMTTDDALILWAAGYDADGNYIDDIVCNWSVNGTLDPQAAAGVSSFTFDPMTAETSGFLIAVNGTYLDSAGLITVEAGNFNHIMIRDESGGAGSEVTDVLMGVGESLTLYSAGYDADNNYLGEKPCNWTTTGTLNLTTATLSSLFVFIPAITGEVGTIKASFNTTISNETGTITVTDAGIDYIIILDDYGQIVTNHWMDTSETLRVWAMGWNQSTGPICPVAADWTTTGTLDLQTATNSPSFTFAPIHAPTRGIIEAFYGSFWDSTFNIYVSTGPLAFIFIHDAPGGIGAPILSHTMSTEETLTVWSIGIDAKGNYIGGIDCDWMTTGTMNPQTATGVNTYTFEPTTTGTGTIMADDLSGHVGSTGLITVMAGIPAYILIRDGPGGLGNVVGACLLTTNDSLTVWAARYDAEDNYIDDAVCNWSTNGTLDFQSAIGANDFMFEPTTTNTSGYIIAVNGTFCDTAGLIKVGDEVPAYVIIRNAPGGSGSMVNNVLMTLGETLTLYSASYDVNFNYLGDVPCNWTTTGTLNLTTATSTYSFIFEPAAAGESGTIIATFNNTISYETGTIDVVAHGIDLLVIVDDLYQPINIHWMDTTETLRVWAMGWNVSVGPVTPVPANWITTGTLDLQITTSSLSFTFDPVHAPTNGRIETSFGALWDFTQVFVDTGPIAYICIQDAPGSAGINVTTHSMTVEETFTIWSNGFDAEWNYIDNTACDWTTTGTLDPQSATGVKTFTFSPSTPGLGFILADYNATIGDSTGLITATYTTFDIDITSAASSDGWILISFPSGIEGDPLSILVDAKDEGAGCVTWDIVQWYDPTSPPGTQWKTTANFKPPELNTFDYVNNTYGFWIHISSYGDGKLSLLGPLASTGELATIELKAGWNLVGYPFRTAQPAANTFGISGIDDMLCYEPSDPYRLRWFDWLSEDHEPGHGYWAHVAADEILIIQCP